MLGGENKSRPPGYTIVEVMIVLAVSGVMFLIAASFISGRQGRAAFTEGVNDMASNIQDVIQQVQSGKYSDASIECCFAGGTGIGIYTPGSPACAGGGQGTNASCVFLGKVLYFPYDPNGSTYDIFTMAGGRVDSSGNPFTNPWDAYATVIHSPGGSSDPLDLTNRQVTPQNLRVVKVTANGTTSTHGIGFFQNPALSGGGEAVSGAETIGIYYVSPPLSGANNTEANAKSQLTRTSSSLSDPLVSATSADICLTDGNNYADILLGAPNSASVSSGNQLVANVQMDSTNPC